MKTVKIPANVAKALNIKSANTNAIHDAVVLINDLKQVSTDIRYFIKEMGDDSFADQVFLKLSRIAGDYKKIITEVMNKKYK